MKECLLLKKGIEKGVEQDINLKRNSLYPNQKQMKIQYKETLMCERCGKEVPKKAPTQKYCTRCSNIANREMTNLRRNKK